MTDALHEELSVEPKGSFGLKLVAAISALAVGIAVLIGYAYLRQRHAGSGDTAASIAQTESAQAQKVPKAIVLVDEALLQGNKTIVGGTVKNISVDPLGQVSVELELKRRKDGAAEKRLLALSPSQLDPGQEGRYSLELKAHEYGSARLVSLRAGPDSSPVVYTSGVGQKRPPERLESKTIIVGRPPPKRDGFLNSPDNPARVP